MPFLEATFDGIGESPQREKRVQFAHNPPYDIEEYPVKSTSFSLDSAVVVSTLAATWVISVIYLMWRIYLTWAAPQAKYTLQCFLWLNVWMEILNMVPHLINQLTYFAYVAVGYKSKHRSSYYLHGEYVPAVDIFITCCGEQLDVIMDTVAGAASQHYPLSRFSIFVLDDAKSLELKNAILQFNKDRGDLLQKVHYLARNKQDKGGAELVAALDADMIPEKSWLRRTVPHILQNERVGMAAPAQRYYNILQPDPLGQDSKAFSRLTEPIHDRLGGTTCTGSGYVARRRALEDIGGWPLQNAGEDILCGWLLASHGWEMAFVKDEVQFGLAPDSLAAWFKQRVRWTDGNILTYRGLGWFRDNPATLQRRIVSQRLLGWLHIIKTYQSGTDTLMLIMIPWVLFPLENSQVLGPSSWAWETTGADILYLLSVLLSKFWYLKISQDIGLSAFKRVHANRLWSSPLNAARIFSSWIPGNVIGFNITGTVVSEINERSAKLRKPLVARLSNPVILVYMTYIAYAVAPLIYRLQLCLEVPWVAAPTLLVTPSPAAVVFLFTNIMKMSVPVQYMASPPTTPERRELLKKDADGVYRIADERKAVTPPTNMIGWKDIAEVMIIFYVGWGLEGS